MPWLPAVLLSSKEALRLQELAYVTLADVMCFADQDSVGPGGP